MVSDANGERLSRRRILGSGVAVPFMNRGRPQQINAPDGSPYGTGDLTDPVTLDGKARELGLVLTASASQSSGDDCGGAGGNPGGGRGQGKGPDDRPTIEPATAAFAAGAAAAAGTAAIVSASGDKHNEALPDDRPAEQTRAAAGTSGSGDQSDYAGRGASIIRGIRRTDAPPPGLGPTHLASGDPTPLRADNRAGRRPATDAPPATEATEAAPETAAGGTGAEAGGIGGSAERGGEAGAPEAGAVGAARAAKAAGAAGAAEAGAIAGTGIGTTRQRPGEGVVPSGGGVGRGGRGKPPEVQPLTHEYMPKAPGHASIKPPRPSGGSLAPAAHSATFSAELATVYEECEYWEKKYARSKRKCEQYRESADRLGTHLEEEKGLADAQRQNYEQKLARLSSQLEEEKTLAAAQRQNYEKKLARIGSQLEEEKSLAAAQRQSFELELSRLNSLHIRSVNLTGTGLEPVSDQEFGTAFRDLRDQVGEWCQETYDKRTKLASIPNITAGMVARRIGERANLRFDQYAEAVVWTYIEEQIFSAWLPGLGRALQAHLAELHHYIADVDETPNHDRSGFWRAYTASMLFQNTQLQQSQSSNEDYEEQVHRLVSLLYWLQEKPPHIEEAPYNNLREIIAKARSLTAQLRCQRGAVYEVDTSIKVGDAYDSTMMTDIRFMADYDDGGSDGGDGDAVDGDGGDGSRRPRRRKKELLVTSIIANAIVKRPAPKSAQVDVCLSKARVTVLSPE